MLQPRRSLFPILAGTVSLIVGLTILAVGVVLSAKVGDRVLRGQPLAT